MNFTNNATSVDEGYCNIDFCRSGNVVTVFGGVINSLTPLTTNSFVPLELRPKAPVSLGIVGVGDGISLNRPSIILNTNGTITMIGGATSMACVVYAEYYM